MVKMLLNVGADPNLPDNTGESPLYWAVRQGDTAVVQLLLEARADPNRADVRGQTPLDWADCEGKTDVAKLLKRGRIEYFFLNMLLLSQCVAGEHDRAMFTHVVWNFCPSKVTQL